MSRMTGGAGGYGGISTFNTDQRGSPYEPHKGPIVKYTSYDRPGPAYVRCECIHCRKKWEHVKGEPWGSAPEVCDKEKKHA